MTTVIMTKEQQAKYLEGWDPYAWHEQADRPGHERGPRWRVKEGKFQERHQLISELDVAGQALINGALDMVSTLNNLAEWDRVRCAILACEEFEDGTDPVADWQARR